MYYVKSYDNERKLRKIYKQHRGVELQHSGYFKDLKHYIYLTNQAPAPWYSSYILFIYSLAMTNHPLKYF